ncbi:putative methyltransferase PMT26 [Acorus calamus]|uniref:Methyltransferase PMT26 n=1 Tax=Acorus calamus TaxID=4465 RepID=A0AAV9ECA0_ACOCL|nr:putative methyltransferase PMT26 [Acorus calamus]
MAFGKNPRMDNRRSSSSSYCSTVTLVVFVALCLVGVWMMTSSAVVPIDMSPSEDRPEQKEQITETNSRPFEDSSGDVTDTTNGDSDAPTDETDKKGFQTQNPDEEVREETNPNPIKENQETKSEPESENSEEKKDEGGETNGDTNGDAKDAETTNTEQQQEQSEEEKKNTESEGGVQEEKKEGQIEEKVEEKNTEDNSGESKNEVFPDGAQSEILKETTMQNGSFSTQSAESKKEKEVQAASSGGQTNNNVYNWKLCNVIAGPDYIPCLDNVAAIKKLHSTKHYEHRERHCPEEGPTCLVPLPEGYRRRIDWPKSRDKIWYFNVPHVKLAEVKGHQNWVKVTGEYLTFPGGGTQFKHGALHYIDFIQDSVPDISWGKRSRVILDVGCGVASLGGYLFERDVLTMSFAPKDEHEAQVQFALERGIPAVSAVMGTKRLPFPGRVFDVVHCARCRVPWHIEGGTLLLELNRLLRPGGYFVWSATPVYQKLPEDVGIWEAMKALTKSMCWDLVTIKRDAVNQVGAAIFKKPMSNECYEKRKQNEPPLCQSSDDANAAWNVPLQACMHKLPMGASERGSRWPEQWPERLDKAPYWLNSSQVGVYGKAAPQDFMEDYEHWKHVVSKSYLNGMGINWSTVRNVMDMRAVYGGFAAALKDLKVWVMNVVSVDAPDTLPIIYERGLFGIYHDWCESFNTYPRTYDLLHADHLFSKLSKRCKLTSVMAEVDRILRPEGKLIVRDKVATITELENMARSLQWEVRMTYSKDNEGLLCVQKSMWRPKELESSSIA